jgi:serine/threonine-protein kinase
MPLSAGARLGNYEILAQIGAGGMGEVYRARDTRLDREVAVKTLPEAFAADPDRMARFEREAKLLAALNHPNIAAIYGVEEHALVMELVEGETLQGPLPIETALNYAKQIADALEAAHEKGIVHRDLKPANIKITPEDRVKVLDFGLAKALSNDSAPADPQSSPTLTMRATLAGVILGTAAYMSPEQARGQNVDKRADIWAFGVVLYEMLTGRTLFAGPTISDTLAAVLKTEPDLSALPDAVRPAVERCLRKDPRRRWRDIGDVRVALDETAKPPVARRGVPVWAVGLPVLASLVAGAGWWRATRPVDHPLTRLSVDLGPQAIAGLDLTAAISPDGRRMVFGARGPDGKQQLATRLLDQAQPTLLPGTEGGRYPFFSPDGQSIGFFTGMELKKIPVQGGVPATLGSTFIAVGASWGEAGNIVAVLQATGPLYRIPAFGGPRQAITKLGPGELTHRWPQVLPGARAVVFTASPSIAAMDDANIEAVSLQTGQVKIVQRGGYYGRYLPSGHLVYVHQGMLYGARFDAERLEVRGPPATLLEDVAANPATGGGQFAFSTSGTFVYAAGKNAAQSWQLAWLDGSGRMQPLLPAPGTYAHPRFSPDGQKLAFIGKSGDLYVHSLERDTTTRLTFSGNANAPVWAPDGRHLVFQSVSNGYSFYWIRSDGAGEPQRLLERPDTSIPWSLSREGRLAYFEANPETGNDIWTLPLDLSGPDHPQPGKPEPYLRSPAAEVQPKFSPDGRWIAYRSDESGDYQIYVRPFPAATGGKWQISTGGGAYPQWANDGREMFYETGNRIMVVDYKVDGASFIPGKPRLWVEKQLFYTGSSNLDLAPDGKRFAVLVMPEATVGEKGSVHIAFLLNFFDELKRRIP